MPGKKAAKKEKESFLFKRSAGVAFVFVVAALMLIGLATFAGVLLSGVKPPESAIIVQPPVDPSYANYMQTVNKQYSFTDYGKNFAEGDRFNATSYPYLITATPALIINCKYKRTGTYAATDAELERLDLLDTLCRANGNCALTDAEKKDLADRLLNVPSDYRIRLDELANSECRGNVYAIYSPTCPYCAAQHPVLNSLGARPKFVCIASHESDPVICDTMLALKGRESFTVSDAAKASGTGACDAAIAMRTMSEWSLVKE